MNMLMVLFLSVYLTYQSSLITSSAAKNAINILFGRRMSIKQIVTNRPGINNRKENKYCILTYWVHLKIVWLAEWSLGRGKPSLSNEAVSIRL